MTTKYHEQMNRLVGDLPSPDERRYLAERKTWRSIWSQFVAGALSSFIPSSEKNRD
jgi:hypothetical protein